MPENGFQVVELDDYYDHSVTGGTTTFESDRELEALRGAEGIVGHVEITGPGVSSLEVFSTVRCVRGLLRVVSAPAVTSLAGLEHLEAVEELSLVDLEIQSLEPLSALTRASFLSLSRLPIRDLTGLGSLIALGGFSVTESPRLVNLRGLASLSTVGGKGVFIESNRGQLNLVGLEALTDTDYLTIRGNPAMETLTGLDGLERVWALEVYENASLTTLDGLSSLRTVDHSVEVRENGRLCAKELDAFRARFPECTCVAGEDCEAR